MIFSRIELTGESRQENLQKVPSATARWYYDDEDIIKSDIDYPKPLLLLVTTRLGLSGIESYYYDAIKSCFS